MTSGLIALSSACANVCIGQPVVDNTVGPKEGEQPPYDTCSAR
jgi:hypothetical protein